MNQKKIKILLELTKFKISLFSSLTVSVGYILATGSLAMEIFIPIFGILFLACGSSSLNLYQERNTDKLMKRTKGRPIPSGRIEAGKVLTISILLCFLGLLILFLGTNQTAFLLGLFALLWYNGVYTNLKKVTAFAVVPGSLIGSIPPAIGWCAGGESLAAPQIWPVLFFFFIWQIPHFWLLILLYGEQYENSGLPSMTKLFSVRQIKRLIFIWVIATAVTCTLFPFFGLVKFSIINIALYGLAIWLIYESSRMFGVNAHKYSPGSGFRVINIYALLVIMLISIDNLI